MGAWAADPFGNDTACDWKYDLEETDDLSLIETTIARVLDVGEEYLEAPDAEQAVAAADKRCGRARISAETPDYGSGVSERKLPHHLANDYSVARVQVTVAEPVFRTQ